MRVWVYLPLFSVSADACIVLLPPKQFQLLATMYDPPTDDSLKTHLIFLQKLRAIYVDIAIALGIPVLMLILRELVSLPLRYPILNFYRRRHRSRAQI